MVEFERHEPSDQYPRGALVMKVTPEELFEGQFSTNGQRGPETDRPTEPAGFTDQPRGSDLFQYPGDNKQNATTNAGQTE